eukprot:655340-Rhodomonas_salina.5
MSQACFQWRSERVRRECCPDARGGCVVQDLPLQPRGRRRRGGGRQRRGVERVRHRRADGERDRNRQDAQAALLSRGHRRRQGRGLRAHAAGQADGG